MVDYGAMTPLLVKSIQELSLEVDSLTNSGGGGSQDENAITLLQDELNQKDDVIADQQQQINDLSNKLDDLLNKMNDFENSLSACCTAYNANNEAPILDQNVPNPFMINSYIKFYIPSSSKESYLVITDINGIQIKKFGGLPTGFGTITIDGGSLAAGTYQYSLFIDGN
jgi:uncharacterized coiled-coil protein SlyX